MKKIIIGLLIAAVLCFLGWPFATGMMIEDRLNERIEQIDANNPWLAAETTEFERGWFKSRATVEFSLDVDDLPVPAADAEPLQALAMPIPVVIEIAHGPIAFGDQIVLGFSSVTAEPDPDAPPIRALTEMLGIPYVFRFHGVSHFNGSFDFTTDIPAFRTTLPLGELRFSGLDVDGTAAGSMLTVSGHADEIGLDGLIAAGSIEAIAFDLEYQFRPGQLPLSDSTFSIDRAVASSPLAGASPLFELVDLAVSGAIAEADDGALDLTARYSAGRVVAGEDIAVDDVVLALAINGIDAEAADQYARMLESTVDLDAVDPEALVSELQAIGSAVVRRGLTISLAPVGFSTDLGSLAANVMATIDGSGLPADAPIDIRNIAVLLNVLSVDADLTVGKALARDLAGRAMRPQIAALGNGGGEPFTDDQLAAAADAQAGLTLATLAGQGLLVDDGDNYKVEAQFRDGELNVNGAPLGPGLF